MTDDLIKAGLDQAKAEKMLRISQRLPSLNKLLSDWCKEEDGTPYKTLLFNCILEVGNIIDKKSKEDKPS